jgi:hypothetical protein
MEGAGRRSDAWIVLALMGLYAAAYAYTIVLMDTARDVGVAWRIAHGEELPLYGPYVGARWRLGPAWFYLLAPLVGLARSMTVVSVGVGLLASLKFPLAYLAGRRLAGRTCGLAWVALLALPGMVSLEQAVYSHFNLVQAAVLGTLLAAQAAADRPSLLRWAVLGACFSLALHGHPTAIVVGPVLPWAWWRARGRGGVRATAVAAGLAAGGVLPLLPMLVEEARGGFGQLGATAAFVSSGGFGERLAQSPAVLIAFARNAVTVAAAFLAPIGPAGGVIVGGTVLALVLGLAAALFVPGSISLRARRALAAYVLAAFAGLSALRHPASVYFFCAVLALGCGLAAAGWSALCERLDERRRDLPALALAAFSVLASVGFLAARSKAWSEGWQRLPGVVFGHVGSRPDPATPPGDLLPAFALDALGRAACEARDGLSVHGDAATMFELAQALPVWLACGPRDDLRAGGAGPALAGYPVGLWRAAGADVPAGAHGYLWFRDLEAFDSGGRPIFLHAEYPPYRWQPLPMLEWSAESTAQAGDWIAVTQLNPQLARVREPLVELDGARVAPAARNRNTWLYPLAASGRLSLRIVTDDASWLDVVRLRLEAALPRP